jgi:hypothetical protein
VEKISLSQFKLHHFKWIFKFTFYTFNMLLHEAKFLTFCWINYFRTWILRVWVSPLKLSSTQRKNRCEMNYDLRTLRWISISGFTALCWTLAAFSVSWSFYTVGRTPWTGDQLFARPPPAHGTIQTQNKRKHTSILQVEVESTMPVFERVKTGGLTKTAWDYKFIRIFPRTCFTWDCKACIRTQMAFRN